MLKQKLLRELYEAVAVSKYKSKVRLKILQARLQQYVDRELSEVQAGFRRGRGTRDQIANIHWIIEKAREFQKNIYFCFIDYAKDFDCVDHNKLWLVLKEMGISDHLICLEKPTCGCERSLGDYINRLIRLKPILYAPLYKEKPTVTPLSPFLANANYISGVPEGTSARQPLVGVRGPEISNGEMSQSERRKGEALSLS
ncbi:hypothetical protein EYD10_02651 [Varanus komodoensis]|nr:hypothetical protein EYD10_02651 [Varanus komodoensis]